MKKILATLIALITMFQFANVDAAAIDNELAILAAEQDTQNAAPKKVEEVKKPVQKSKQEIEAEKKRLREEQKAAEKKLKEEQKAARKQIEEGKKEVVKLSDSNRNSRTSRTSTGESSRVEKNPAVNTSSNVTPANSNTARTSTPTDSTARNNNSNTNTSTSSGGNSNLVRDYASFDEVTKAVGFTPLYIPKKSGYTVTTISVVGERMAQIKYGRRWEPEVSLYIRTYKRLPNEELKDISGINGVKWRVDMTGGTTVYVAKLSDTAHAAAWAVGEYTFAAYAENLSFAAFHALVVEELVDLSSHYYTN